MIERSYKNLNINRDSIKPLIQTFAEQNSYPSVSYKELPGAQSGMRVSFGRPGLEAALVDIFLNKDGTSTIKYRIGKNHELSKQLADYLYESLDATEFNVVNMVVDGFDKVILDPILALVENETDIEINQRCHDQNKVIWKIKSRKNQDELTVTLHIKTRKLQIQGRPLSCYRLFIFNLSELLDLKGLEKVLIRQDNGKAEIIQQEVACSHLKAVLGETYNRLHKNVEKLLISGLCVKLAAPALPDYCFLLYPELRSIEGILKERMTNLGLAIDRASFGEFFRKNEGRFVLKEGYISRCLETGAVEILNDAYTFYNKERHTLFHMEPIVEASRVISNISHLMTKSNQAWIHIKNLYSI